MSPSSSPELEPTPSPETEGQGVKQPETTPGAEKKEDSINAKIEAKAKSRTFRDSFIEEEEVRWYTEEKKSETIANEKM